MTACALPDDDLGTCPNALAKFRMPYPDIKRLVLKVEGIGRAPCR